MKRLVAAVLILSLMLSVMTACNNNEEPIPDDTAVQTAVLDEFNQIAQIPSEPGYERAMSSYLRSWARENGLEAKRDSSNNVIITKPAAAGYENVPFTILQCNTSLDSDGGIGMASILYILKNSNSHGNIRAIFTTGGESDMNGAEKLNKKYLEGAYLINFGWENGTTIGLGSGGTASYDMLHEIQWTTPRNAIPYILSISGLKGGDANEAIGNGGANAIKIIGEILANAQGKGILFELGSFNGGDLRDKIPTEAAALIIINESDRKKMQNVVNDAMKAFESSYGDVDEDFLFTYQETERPDKVVSFEDNGSIISFVYGIVNGVQSISESYGDVVESASNLGRVSTSTGNFIAQISATSTTDIGLYEITRAHEAISAMSNLQYTYHAGVPRWPDHPDSVLFSKVQEIYVKRYNDRLPGSIIHKESECGWFAKKNPKLQIVSIGVDMERPDRTDEKVVQKSITRPIYAVMAFLEETNSMHKIE